MNKMLETVPALRRETRNQTIPAEAFQYTNRFAKPF